MKKTQAVMADGREIIYYDTRDDVVRDAVDTRDLAPVVSGSELRYDRLLDEWVVVASHRQTRTHLPAADACPLCPATPERAGEVADTDYEVVVFENRFPPMSGAGRGEAATTTAEAPSPFPTRPAAGRCEVVVYTADHDASFKDLTPERARLVLDTWTDRTAELSALPEVEQVYCFENRGREIGVTLPHSHGQIYAYPFVTPRTAAMIRSVTAHRHRTGRNLFDDIVADERAAGTRIVAAGEHWTAFVPAAARWPYEVHLYPNRRVPDLLALDEDARAEFGPMYLDLVRRFDGLFDGEPAPYIAAWQQAPVRADRVDFALHLELFSIRRAPGKLKYLAGSESGMDVFISDVPPETAAARIREVGA
ncbi:galactose-1-phosphate uridylyltransferase [Streptomyces sp. SID3343]|uniref:galactose-1-phosphate uridylyltransferase n=1 Tax=Streptomyces sp. SID3343 TaxID=2690260 RepID=UPI00136BF016|nr:galactose-1-phosphate uridylyltransferase [Streptomyces sp. SID3343]MYW00780.1 galactose-1-phosphate uridylyltransferase [Streptomyces sp. SID3343]